MQVLDLSHNAIEKLDNKSHGLIDDCLSLEKVNIGKKVKFMKYNRDIISDKFELQQYWFHHSANVSEQSLYSIQTA